MSGKPNHNFARYLFLPLLPVFFVLHGFNEHFPIVSAADAFQLSAEYLLVALFITCLFLLLLRSWEKATVFTFVLLLIYLFFGAIHDFVKKIGGNSFLPKYNFLLPFLIVLAIVVFVLLKIKKQPFKKLIGYLNLLMIVLLVMEIGSLFIHYGRPAKTSTALQIKGCDSCNKPDVYVIVADGYAGKKELEQVLGFDNSLFENQLRQRGFFITDSSLSNYNYTPFSMASFFSMDYLQGLEGRNKSANDRQVCYRALNANPVIGFFKKSGYSIKNFSVFRFNDDPPLVTTSFHKSGKDLITQHTLWGRINRDVRVDFAFRHNITSEIARASYHERDVNERLFKETLDEINRKPGKPRFVYTHLSMPHYPYYFNKDGKPYPLIGLVEDATQFSRERYLQYLQYCNSKLLELVDQIQSRSSSPPVILLMSDHGFREFRDEEKIDHKYQFMNLDAMLLPGKNYDGFYKGMSMVNKFRMVLNKEFRQQLPLLKDSCNYLTE